VKGADVELRFWFGLFGPKGMSDTVKAKLEKAIAMVMSDPHLRERLANLDITPDLRKIASLFAHPGAFAERAKHRLEMTF